jgi:hypothetical protein
VHDLIRVVILVVAEGVYILMEFIA